MAIQCRDYQGKPEQVKELPSIGFELWATTDDQCQWIYVIPRTNDDGTPYESKLFDTTRRHKEERNVKS